MQQNRCSDDRSWLASVGAARVSYRNGVAAEV